MEPKPISDTKEGDPLQTKYYCRIDNSQHMNVVMEMVPSGGEVVQRLPLRYVVVIDVSDSMDNRVGIQQRTLLQRVQLFAELAVRKMTESDWMAIVTFSGDCVIEMPMTRMNFHNRQMARNILKRLTTRGNTNLECGLMGALEAIKSSPKMFRASRDCVILFTDGEANAGELSPEVLIEKYRRAQSNMGLRSCVPVSAFTIGGYHPDLLIQISKQLGSESFYWLDEEEDFEADMLIPLFLRERTSISDVDITIGALDNCYFDPVDENAAHFTGKQTSKVKVRRNKKKKKLKEPTKLFFFIHSLPQDNPKNICFDVALPQMPLEELDGKMVIDITLHFLDAEMMPKTIHDYILISTKNLLQSRRMDQVASNNSGEMSTTLMQVSAFIMTQNHARTSWKEAQEVIVKIAEQKCKSASVASIANAKQNMGDSKQVRKVFQAASEEITTINEETQKFFPEGGTYLEWITKVCHEYKSRVNYANDVSASNDERNYSRLSSMESSLHTEMPTSGGVFRGKQPFMSAIMEEKLLEEKKNLEAARRLQSGPEIDVGTAKHRMQKATRAGNLADMKQCQQDLKALELFGMGVEEEYLEYVEREIVHRNQLDGLKGNLHGALINEDYGAVTKLLDEMRGLRAKSDLTFTEGDKVAFQKGSNELILYQRKRGMRAEIASTMSSLNLPFTPQNMEKITKAIEYLVRLKNQAKDFDDVFTERDNTLLNLAIANTAGARKQMDSITRRMDETKPALSLSMHPSNYEAISEAVKEMSSLQIESQKFEGLFTEHEEQLLKTACDHRDSLDEEKDRLLERIQNAIPTLELPMLPRNFQMLSEAVDEMASIRQRAILFKDFFLPEYELKFNEASTKVATLLTKKEDLVEKIAGSSLNARLPKLPANLDNLKLAVDSLTVAKEESKGFENVFTDEYVKMLQSAEASMKILETEKEEIEKEKEECLDQIQLPMIPTSFNQICQGIDTMKRILPEMKGFGLYEDSYDDLLKKASFNKDVLNDKKDKILKELQETRHGLKVTMIPDNLNALRCSVDKMKSLKEESVGFDNVFTTTNESDLFEATENLKHLTENVEKMNEARHNLERAVEGRKYIRLKRAVKKASRAPFIARSELKEPRKLLSFLDPEKRCAAVKNAIEIEDIEEIEETLLEMREASVVNDKLEEEANLALRKLRKKKRREERERRRIEKEKARRKREMERIESTLSEAMESKDVESLEQALEEFEVSEFDESEVPLSKEATELLRHLRIERMRGRLLEGMTTRKVELLYNALMDAKYGNFEEHMQKEYTEAEELLIYLLEMMRLREEIMKMTRAGISEVHSYSKPPSCIKKTMRAIFTILGESSEGIKTWAKIQGLMGKLDRNSITKRVQRFKIKDLAPETAEKAGKFLTHLDLEEVESASKVAATFYAWAKYIVKEVEHMKEMTEKKSKEQQAAENDTASQKYDQEDFESDDENHEQHGDPQEQEISIKEANNSEVSADEIPKEKETEDDVDRNNIDT